MMYKSNFVAVIKSKGKILREHEGGAVFLPFGSEYSILVKNQDSRDALVRIQVDGVDALNGSGLVVKGNTSQEVVGFMKNMSETNRFKFIHKTEEIQNYRGDRIDDGLVRVTHQFTEHKPIPVTHFVYNTPWWNGGSYYTSDGNNDNGITYRATFSSSVKSCSSSAPLSDEGITVKGNKVDQNYIYTNIGKLEANIYTMIFHLKGMTKGQQSVVKPVTVRTKLICEICGKKNKFSNKFCWNCGTYIGM